MNTITLEYDGTSQVAKDFIKLGIRLGVFRQFTESSAKKSGIEESEDDIKNGRVYSAESTDDLFKKILETK